MSRFEASTAIVTGASRGIGLGIAERLVQDGANVVVTGRRQETLDEAVVALGGHTRALGVAGHADDVDHQAETLKRAIDAFGSADLLVNNTGINPVYGPMVDLDLDAARKTVDVNCLAALSWVQQAHRAWMEEHGGAVVNVSSVAGLRPAPGIGFYGATKAMLAHLTEELAVELGPGIRVNAVAPAVVKTKFATALYEGREDEVAAAYPLKRLGVPDDIAGAVAFLLSADSGWITGQTWSSTAASHSPGVPDMTTMQACQAHEEPASSGVVGGPEKAAYARKLGADVVVDRHEHDFVEVVTAETGGRGADVVYDPVGGDVYQRSTKCIAFEGRILVVGFAGGDIQTAALNHALVKNYSILGLHWGLYNAFDPAAVAACHRDLTALADSGAVRPLVSERLGLDTVADGLQRLADGDTVGRAVHAPHVAPST